MRRTPSCTRAIRSAIFSEPCAWFLARVLLVFERDGGTVRKHLGGASHYDRRLEPATTAILSGGAPGDHDVEGIGIGFVPPLLDRDIVHEVRGIDEAESREMARRLAREEGLFAGASTGLNVVAAVQLASELGAGKTVVTVAVDTGLKYLDSDLYPV